MPVSKNRWVSIGAATEPDPAPGAQEVPAFIPTGPTRPQLSVPQPDHVDRLPRWNIPDTTTQYWWLGVHGGAGETSLARLEKHTRAAEHHWPLTASGSTVVLVARSNMSGLLAAQRAATEWASGSVPGIQVAGLLVLTDAPGRIPKEIRDFARIVGGGVPQLWNMPWIDEWRLGHDVPVERLPKEVRTVLERVRLAATSTPAGSPAT